MYGFGWLLRGGVIEDVIWDVVLRGCGYVDVVMWVWLYGCGYMGRSLCESMVVWHMLGCTVVWMVEFIFRISFIWRHWNALNLLIDSTLIINSFATPS